MVPGRSLNLSASKCLYRSVVDPGEGPRGPTPLTFGPICGLKGREKFFFLDRPIPLISGSGWPGPPLSEDLDPPIQVHYNNQVTFLVVSRQLMVLYSGYQYSEYNTINWRDTTHFDSEDDYRTGCRNVSHCQQQQSYSGLCSPGGSNSTYFWNDSWVQTSHSQTLYHTRISLHTTLQDRRENLHRAMFHS